MQDYETLIQKMLVSDERLRDYVAKLDGGIPNIMVNQAPSGKYPLITYERIAGGDFSRADGRADVINRVFQVSVFNYENDFQEVESVIDELFHELHFSSIFEYQDKNPDTNIIGFSKHFKILSDGHLYARNLAIVQPRFEKYIQELY